MLNDTPKGLLDAVKSIMQQDAHAYAAEQAGLQEKYAAKKLKEMPQGKSDEPAVKGAGKMAEEADLGEAFKAGDFVKDTRGNIHRVHEVRGTTLHTSEYRGNNSYGGNTTLHTTKATKVPKPASVTEEAEQIDELSKTTLKSYTDKAAQQTVDSAVKSSAHAHLALDAERKGLHVLARVNQKAANKAQAHSNKRVAGMIKAAGKMKEEVERIDELKVSTVKSYADKRAAQVSDTPAYPFKNKIPARVVQSSAKGLMGALQRIHGKKATSEEVERIDEISQKTLASYTDKVVDPVYGMPRSTKKLPQRLAGLQRAHQRIKAARAAVKEEAEQIDELSSDTLNAYMRKRKKSINRLAGAGATTNSSDTLRKHVDNYRKAWAKRDAKNEEVEQIDELSKDKTQRYLDRAMGDHDHQNMGRRNTSGEEQKEYARKEGLRKKGISRAVERLTKNEEIAPVHTFAAFMIEEEAKKLHPDHLHVSDAGKGKYKVHSVGKNLAHGIKVGEHISDSELDDASEMGARVKMVKNK
jgi:hypothetical protein